MEERANRISSQAVQREEEEEEEGTESRDSGGADGRMSPPFPKVISRLDVGALTHT